MKAWRERREHLRRYVQGSSAGRGCLTSTRPRRPFAKEAVIAMPSVAPTPDANHPHPDACPACLDNLELPYYVTDDTLGTGVMAYYGCHWCGHAWKTGWAA